MNYIIKIAHGTEYFINANTLLDLYLEQEGVSYDN